MCDPRNRATGCSPDRPPGPRIRLLREAAFTVLAVTVLPWIGRDVVARWADRALTQQQVEAWIAQADSAAAGGARDTHLSAVRTAFERIAMDLEERRQHGRRYFDREYIAGQIDLLQAGIAAAPRPALHLLAYYALQEQRPLQQALAILAVRECYPKKYSVFFATRYARVPDPLLAGVCRSILSGRYRPAGLENRFRPEALEELAGLTSRR